MFTTLLTHLAVISIAVFAYSKYHELKLNSIWLVIALASYSGFLCIQKFELKLFDNELLLPLIHIFAPHLERLSWPWDVTITTIFYCLALVIVLAKLDIYQDKQTSSISLIKYYGFTFKQQPNSLTSCVKLLILVLIARYYLSLIVGGDDGVRDAEELLFLATAEGLDKTLFFFGFLHLAYSQVFRLNPKLYHNKHITIDLSFTLTAFTFACYHGLHLVSFEHNLIYITSFLLMASYAVVFLWMKIKTGSLLVPAVSYGVIMFFSQLL